jgi:hypothetical protein
MFQGEYEMLKSMLGFGLALLSFSACGKQVHGFVEEIKVDRDSVVMRDIGDYLRNTAPFDDHAVGQAALAAWLLRPALRCCGCNRFRGCV